jgi:ABC-type phosphate/phosphonate transport system substrate-binding protein
MYDPPELRGAVDAWWHGLAVAFRAEGVADVPDCLDRSLSFDALWSEPDLLFAQACGFPLMGAWADRLQYLATPRYAAPGCEGSRYCSVIVVTADSKVQCLEDLRGARCSINSRISHSGFNALRAHVAPLARDGRFFGAVRLSGGHAESVDEILCGKADVTAIDCVSYELFRRVRPAAIAATRVVGHTARAPGLPYVTRIDVDLATRDRLVAALRRAFADPALASVRAQLLIEGFDVLPPGSYRCMLDMAGEAKRRGYDELDE